MKRLFATMGFVCCLAFAVQAFSAFHVFGPDFARFKVDVPDGWKASPNQGGCQIDSPDETSSVSIQMQKAGGKTAAEFAAAIAKNLPFKIINIEKENDTQSIRL